MFSLLQRYLVLEAFIENILLWLLFHVSLLSMGIKILKLIIFSRFYLDMYRCYEQVAQLNAGVLK